MADRSITVRLLGDAGNLGKAFKDAGQEAGSLEGKLSGLGGHLSGLGSAFSGIATTAAGFLSANVLGSAPGFFMDAAKGAAEDEAATNRLNQTLQNLVDRHAAGGLSVSELKDRMDEAIGSGQKLAFTDDEIRDSMGYLLNATDDVNDAQRRQSVAMDLARGANIDLQTATKLLGKMTDENVNTFKKLGIELPKTATEADALAAVQARFGGQADKFAKSTAGQFEQLKIRMSEAKETIGYAVLPVMAAVGEILATKVVPLVEKLAAAFQERALPVIARAGSIVTNHVVPALLDLGRVFTDRVMPVMEKIGGAVGSALVATWQENIAPAFATVRDVAESLAPTLANIAGTVGELATAVADRLAGPLQAVFGFLADHKDDLKIVAAAFAVAVPVVYAIAAAHAAEATAATAAAVAEGVALLPIIAISAAVGVLALGIYELIKHWDDITAKYPAIGEATEAVKEKLSAFAGWVTDTFVPAVLGIYNGVKDAVDKAVGWVRDNWDTISAIISPAVAALEVVIKGAWNQIQTDIQTVWGVLKGIFDTISALLHGDFSGAWTGLQETVSAVWEGIKGSAQNALTVLQGLGGAFFDALKGIGSNMADGLVNGLATIAEKAGNIAGAIQDALKEAMNIALRWAHDNLKVHVPGFDTHTPFGKIGDFDIAFPLLQLARGGIVDRPTIALIGEAGPEAVVPLTGPNLIREMAPMGASSAAVELHVHISALDTRGLEDFVARNADVFLRPLDLALKRAGQAGLVAAR